VGGAPETPGETEIERFGSSYRELVPGRLSARRGSRALGLRLRLLLPLLVTGLRVVSRGPATFNRRTDLGHELLATVGLAQEGPIQVPLAVAGEDLRGVG